LGHTTAPPQEKSIVDVVFPFLINLQIETHNN
jgi:hypothetical protein